MAKIRRIARQIQLLEGHVTPQQFGLILGMLRKETRDPEAVLDRLLKAADAGAFTGLTPADLPEDIAIGAAPNRAERRRRKMRPVPQMRKDPNEPVVSVRTPPHLPKVIQEMIEAGKRRQGLAEDEEGPPATPEGAEGP